MKTVFELIPGEWYNVRFKPSSKYGYEGPAKFIRDGDFVGLLNFVLPEDLHTLKSDEEFVNYSYFAAKDVVSKFEGETPLDYFGLLDEIERLKNEFDYEMQSMQEELEANRH